MKVRLDAIVFDAGTQIRAAINESLVADYAERMTEGDAFPPVVLFHDGNRYYMADGFHRGMASLRVDFKDIEADVRPGTKEDALWFALGANKMNGHRMTSADKQHAIVLALRAWPDMSMTKLSKQIGVNQGYASKVRQQVNATVDLPERVTGKDGKSYPASRQTSQEKPRAMMPDRSPAASAERRKRLREMADEGYSTRQIADKLEITEDSCNLIAKTDGIVIRANAVLGRPRRHDPNRIVERIVIAAEHLTADVNLIDFAHLKSVQLGPWISSLQTSRRALVSFIRQLEQEQKKHGEAA